MGSKYIWLLSTGGNIDVAHNWSPYTNLSPGTTLPGSADEADFNNAGGTITGDLTVAEWNVDASAGLYTFAGNVTATFFDIEASASLSGKWTSDNTDTSELGVVVDGLLVLNDGSITVASSPLGIGYNGSGTVSAGAGSSLSAATIELGAHSGASGTLALSDGASADVSGNVVIGAAPGSSGDLTLASGATLAASGLFDGAAGGGTMNVSGAGATVTVGTGGLVVGDGASGSLTLGNGARLTDSSGVDVGLGSSGTLNVASGATFAATGLFDGIASAGSIGTGSIDVSDAVVTIGDGGVVVGDGGTGSLTLENGAILTDENVVDIGFGNTGSVVIETGATLIDGSEIDIGIGGTGSLIIQSGASLTSAGAALGLLDGMTPGSGTVTLDNSHWTSTGQVQLAAGSNATGRLLLSNGATLLAGATLASTVPFLFIDGTAAGHATVDVGNAAVKAGANSVLVGSKGFGTLTLHDGAVLDAGNAATQAAFVLGDMAGASGSASLTGPATTVDLSGDAIIGQSGSGTLAIGGTFTVSGNMDLAVSQSATATVTVTGAGGELAIGGQLDIGGAGQAGGTGALSVGSGGTLTAASLALFAGGTLTVDTNSTAEVGSGGARLAGQLLVDAGITTGGSGEVAASVTNNGTLVAQSGTLIITGQAAGDGTYGVANAASLLLDQPGDANIRFLGSSGTVELGTASGSANVQQMSGNDTFHIVGLGTGAHVTYAGHTATVAGSLGSWNFTFAAAPPALAVTTQGTDAQVIACYAEGTAIATPTGQTPIEHHAVGALVDAQFEGVACIKWIGRRRIDCGRHARPEKVWPVRVRAGALGDNSPHRDLWLSPDHAVFVDDVLIPIKRLINGTSIEQVPIDEVTYYHVELERHDLLLAEGVRAESYLETGDRFNFENSGGPVMLHPEFSARRWDIAHIWEALGGARLIITGPELDAARARIITRTAAIASAASAA